MARAAPRRRGRKFIPRASQTLLTTVDIHYVKIVTIYKMLIVDEIFGIVLVLSMVKMLKF